MQEPIEERGLSAPPDLPDSSDRVGRLREAVAALTVRQAKLLWLEPQGPSASAELGLTRIRRVETRLGAYAEAAMQLVSACGAGASAADPGTAFPAPEPSQATPSSASEGMRPGGARAARSPSLSPRRGRHRWVLAILELELGRLAAGIDALLAEPTDSILARVDRRLQWAVMTLGELSALEGLRCAAAERLASPAPSSTSWPERSRPPSPRQSTHGEPAGIPAQPSPERGKPFARRPAEPSDSGTVPGAGREGFLPFRGPHPGSSSPLGSLEAVSTGAGHADLEARIRELKSYLNTVLFASACLIAVVLASFWWRVEISSARSPSAIPLAEPEVPRMRPPESGPEPGSAESASAAGERDEDFESLRDLIKVQKDLANRVAILEALVGEMVASTRVSLDALKRSVITPIDEGGVPTQVPAVEASRQPTPTIEEAIADEPPDSFPGRDSQALEDLGADDAPVAERGAAAEDGVESADAAVVMDSDQPLPTSRNRQPAARRSVALDVPRADDAREPSPTRKSESPVLPDRSADRLDAPRALPAAKAEPARQRDRDDPLEDDLFLFQD